MKIIPIKRALLSVSDKTGLVEFAQSLTNAGVDIVSTGGTSKLLKENNIPHRQVEELTGLTEMLDGRVKTLHPKIHGGILGRRDEHAEEAKDHGIEWIDLVVVNFYPFADSVKNAKQALSWDQAIEYIDIGGPTMVRAAAKNFAWVGVVVDPSDYKKIAADIREQGGLDFDLRRNLAQKVFALTGQYDNMISQYFLDHQKEDTTYPTRLNLQFEKHGELRYGENPHQKACAYLSPNDIGLLSAKQHQGKALSYNNILDAEAALNCVREFEDPACVIVKHANPCGVASASNIDEAYAHAYQADPISAFGGVIALNRPCTKTIADAISAIFMEVIIAPSYSQEALQVFSSKPNLRVLEMPIQIDSVWEMKFITGGVLMQEKDHQIINANDLKVVTHIQPKSDEINSMLFAWRVLKHIKSNGILIAKNHVTIGIGAGQVSRIDAVELALKKAKNRSEGTVLASDAFFPFRDSIDVLANKGISAVIQPGGSVRDEEVIAACNELGIAMVFTGKRCFRH